MNRPGLTHVYCGSGKGKTTAAIGLAVRAAGAGLHVLIVQFLKGQDTGELRSLALIPNITVVRGKASERFTFQMDERERAETRELSGRNLAGAVAAAKNGECELLILDEALGALEAGMLDEAALRELVCEKPEGLELVLTGRNPREWIISSADYVSEIVPRKHPYERGIAARSGIEY